jgi:hypothetical protein
VQRTPNCRYLTLNGEYFNYFEHDKKFVAEFSASNHDMSDGN